MLEGKRYFDLGEPKPAWSQWFVTLDIAEWLATDTIQTVSFSAIREDTGEDASAGLLDQAKCTFTGSYLKPYVRGGQPGASYLIEMRVTTNAGDRDVWWLRVEVLDYWLSATKSLSLDAILMSS